MKSFMRKIFLIVFSFVVINTAANAAPWTFKFSGANGISLSYNGVPVIYKSTLYVVKPGWTGRLYNQTIDKQTIQKKSDGSWHITGQGENFRAEYDLKTVDARTFQVHFRGELLKDIPAQMELNLGYFNGNLIAGRPFTAEYDGGKSTFAGMVPAYPKQQGLVQNDLAPGFGTLNFDSRLGKMSLEIDAPKPMIFADGRDYSRFARFKQPSFWCGWMAGMQPIKVNDPVEAVLTIRLEPVATAKSPSLSIAPDITLLPDAYAASSGSSVIVPKPQQMELNEKEHFTFPSSLKWRTSTPGIEDGKRLDRAVRKLFDGTNITVEAPIHPKNPFGQNLSGIGPDLSGIRLGSDALIPIFPVPVTETESGDGYSLSIDKDGILILSRSARGAFYGLQTLRQLMRFDDGKITVPYAQIKDWPTLEFRGVHWYPSQSAFEMDKKIIDIMAHYKINYAVIQCEAARWDSHPEIAVADSISKKDLAELVQRCRDNFIEPIPLINGPGHAQWMFTNKQNRDLAEDPNALYPYAVNNPKSIQFVHDIMAEAIAVFHPKNFHIGSDEVNRKARFPNPENPFNPKGTTLSDLLLKNLQTHHDWLAKQGIETIFWGDMFLSKTDTSKTTAANAESPEIAAKDRATIPKDAIVADWQYSGKQTAYPSLAQFKAQGLRTVACPWYDPQNIRNLTQAAIKNSSWGLLQTTWNGFFPNEKTMNSDIRQYGAYILAADYSWSGRDDAPADLPYKANARWLREYNKSGRTRAAGAALDLSKAAQTPITDWLGLGEGWDLAQFMAQHKSTFVRLSEVQFRIAADGIVTISDAPGALKPAGALHDLTISVNRKASEIALLDAALWNVPDKVAVAKCTVNYANGTSVVIDISTGSYFGPWQDYFEGEQGVHAWEGKSSAGTPIALYARCWRNPFPEKEVASLHLEPLNREAGYALAGLSLID